MGGIVAPEHAGDLRAHDALDAAAIERGRLGVIRAQGRYGRLGAGGGVRRGRRQVVEQRATALGVVYAGEPLPIDPRDRGLRPAAAQKPAERAERLPVVERAQADPVVIGLGLPGRAAAGPPAPVDRKRRQPEPPPAVGQGVHELVARGIGGESARPPQRRARRKHHEEIEREVAREVVENPRPVHLGAEDIGEPRAVGRFQFQERDHARRVHDAAQGGQVAAETLEQGAHRFCIAGVGRDDRNARARLLERLDFLAGLVGVHPAAADQHQVARAPGRKPARDLEAEAAHAARDEVSPVRIDPHRLGRQPARAHESRHEPARLAQADLVLAVGGGQLGRKPRGGRGGRPRRVEVDQAAPNFRPLQRDDPAQPPQGALNRIDGDLGSRLRTARDDPQRRLALGPDEFACQFQGARARIDRIKTQPRGR